MHQHRIRHLPVIDRGTAVTVISIRDLIERGGRAPRQDHRRAGAGAAEHDHLDSLTEAGLSTSSGDFAVNSLIVLAALVFLMLVAYRGYSVILFAPIAALGAVLLTDPSLVPPMFSGVFMEKMVGFVKIYFPVFMLGAVFGKVIELSGFSEVDRRPPSSACSGKRTRDAVDRGGLRAADLWRRVAVRRGVRGLSVRRRDVPPERHSEAADPGHDRARRVHASRWMRCPARRRSRTSSRRRSSRRRLGRAHGWA